MPAPDSDPLSPPGWAEPAARGVPPSCPAAERYGERIEQLMARLLRLRRRLHDPARRPGQEAALRARMAWLHDAIFAISAELDCSY